MPTCWFCSSCTKIRGLRRPWPRAAGLTRNFFYPLDKPLTQYAHERLATFDREHTELCAGMYVVMKDIESRGVGNLLGGE